MQKAALSELVDLHTVVRHSGQVQTLEPKNSQINQLLKIVIIKVSGSGFLTIWRYIEKDCGIDFYLHIVVETLIDFKESLMVQL